LNGIETADDVLRESFMRIRGVTPDVETARTRPEANWNDFGGLLTLAWRARDGFKLFSSSSSLIDSTGRVDRRGDARGGTMEVSDAELIDK
jgi:hypothetical protein